MLALVSSQNVSICDLADSLYHEVEDLEPASVIYEYKEFDSGHDTKCPFWDHSVVIRLSSNTNMHFLEYHA